MLTMIYIASASENKLYSNLCIRLDTWRVPSFVTKSLHVGQSNLIHGSTGRLLGDLTDSNVDLFVYLIEKD